jgi:hypothetical protein
MRGEVILAFRHLDCVALCWERRSNHPSATPLGLGCASSVSPRYGDRQSVRNKATECVFMLLEVPTFQTKSVDSLRHRPKRLRKSINDTSDFTVEGTVQEIGVHLANQMYQALLFMNGQENFGGRGTRSVATDSARPDRPGAFSERDRAVMHTRHFAIRADVQVEVRVGQRS